MLVLSQRIQKIGLGRSMTAVWRFPPGTGCGGPRGCQCETWIEMHTDDSSCLISCSHVNIYFGTAVSDRTRDTAIQPYIVVALNSILVCKCRMFCPKRSLSCQCSVTSPCMQVSSHIKTLDQDMQVHDRPSRSAHCRNDARDGVYTSDMWCVYVVYRAATNYRDVYL